MDKQWYLSASIWGLIIGFVAFVLSQIFGSAVISSEQGTTLVNSIIQLISAGMAIWGFIQGIIGRFKAGKQIVSLRKEVRRLSVRP
jgi:hypothetical protein